MKSTFDTFILVFIGFIIGLIATSFSYGNILFQDKLGYCEDKWDNYAMIYMVENECTNLEIEHIHASFKNLYCIRETPMRELVE